MSDTPRMVHIFDCATGEETIRELTPEEYAQDEALREAQTAQIVIDNEAAVAHNATLQSSRDKFADMGLTAEEIAAIVPADKELQILPGEISEPAE
tara:strand:+ start:771 stop:1058 length:288 start_codon:yes stop_codon:yes gene_type:complete